MGLLKSLPRGTWKAATDYLDPLSPKEDAMLRHALGAAMPIIEKAALKAAAKHILHLDAEDRDRHRHAHRPPWNDMRTVLRKLARGEPLPELPAQEGDHG